MKVVVTGGAGFIGSNIVERLVSEGHDVIVVDNFHTGNKANLSAVVDKVELINSNAGEFFESYNEKVDAIIHDGIYSSSPMYKENPELTAKAYSDFIQLLEYTRKHDVGKVVYASTSSIYNGHKPPHKEDMVPFIKDFYTEARYAMDRVGILYHKLYGFNVVGLRYFSVYGPHEEYKGRYANLVSQFLWALMRDEQPVIYGDGRQTRDFTYVSDVVEANVLALNKTVSGIFNVGTGRSISIHDLVGLLNSKLGKDIEPKYVENPISNYVYTTQADTLKAEKELGFKAKVSLEEGVEKLIQYYREKGAPEAPKS